MSIQLIPDNRFELSFYKNRNIEPIRKQYMNSAALEELSSTKLIEAMEANMFEYMTYYAKHSPEMEIIDEDDVLLINSGLKSDTLNYICRAKFSESSINRKIDKAINYFKSRNLPFTWWISPSSQPSSLGAYLEKYKLQCTERVAGMAADLRTLPSNYPLPKGLTIKRLTTVSELNLFASVVASVFDPPDPCVQLFYQQTSDVSLKNDGSIHLYLGYLHGKPVATSALFMGASVAGIYCVATIKQARKQGIGTALTLAAIQDARNQGYQIATLEASGDGRNLYARIGFKTYCQFYTYQ
jgi:ribosomal protein S18 acetylase RimI-like enzyme